MIEQIQEKLQQLLKQYDNLKAENDRLKNKLEQQESLLSDRAVQIRELEMQLSAAQLAVGTVDNEQRKDIQKRIDSYLKEIDRCLELLKLH